MAQLLSDIRRRASIPTTSTDWTDVVILREASDVIHSLGAWALHKSGDGRMKEMFQRAVTAGLASPYGAGRDFELPPLAVGDTIDNVVWVDSTGVRERRMTRIDAPTQSLYDQQDSTGDPVAYSLASGRIRLYPQPTTGGIVRFNYSRRHPELVADTTANVETATSASDVGSGYSRFAVSGSQGLAVGDYVDLLNGEFPYRVIFSTLYVGAVSGGNRDLFVPYSYVSGLPVAGMRIVRAGRSPYVHLPLEMRTILSDKTASVIMRVIGDVTGAMQAEGAADKALGTVLDVLNPRTESDRLKAYHPHSLVRGRAAQGSRGWGRRWG